MGKEYLKELDRVYLVLDEDQIDEDEYVLQMALRGALPGILPLSVSGKDGKRSLRADVTACTSITSRFKNTTLPASDLRRILSSIRDTASRMPSLLMSVRDLCLDPDCIFLGAGGDEVLLCYVPHLSSSDPDSIRLLAEFLLKKTDHADKAAARLAYDLYDQVQEEAYDLSDLLTKLLRSCEFSDAAEDFPSAGCSKSFFLPQDYPSSGCSKSTLPSEDSGISEGASRHGFSEDAAYSEAFGSPKGSVYSGSSGYSSSAGAPVRRLPPPDKKNRRKPSRKRQAAAAGTVSGRKKQRAGAISARKGKRKHAESYSVEEANNNYSPKKVLPAAVILTAGCICAVLFRMDLSQIMGTGFLCASVIWIVYASIEKHESETRNRWFDEDDSDSDDQFYQSLRRELYEEDPLFRDRAQRSMPSFERHTQRDMPSSEDQYQRGMPSSEGQYQRGMPSSEDQYQHGMPSSENRTRYLRPQDSSPSLISLRKELSPDIPLRQDQLILGKSRSQADVILPGDTISRRHARIERRTDGYYVTDLFSTNGTFLDGHRLESGHAVALKDGAQLTIASLSYRVFIPSDLSV